MNEIKNLFVVFSLIATVFTANAQSYYQPYGKIDTADLKLTLCDFEKDANAEILFDNAIETVQPGKISIERHVRIKIFNQTGERSASVTIPYIDAFEEISDLKAQTINLNDQKIEYIPVEAQSIYNLRASKYTKLIKFAFPNVKPGSIIEYKYVWQSFYSADLRPWFFENELPVRFSRLSYMNYWFMAYGQAHVTQPFIVDNYITPEYTPLQVKGAYVAHIWALANIPSFKKEPFMGDPEDNLQYIKFASTQLTGINEIKSKLLDLGKFGNQLDADDIQVNNNHKFTDSVNALPDEAARIESVFNAVKNRILWNGINSYSATDGVRKCWQRKSGNSTEINLILYNLLKSVGVKCYPMLISTREHGKIDFSNLYLSSFNKTVIYIPQDSTNYYVLDATSRQNTFNTIPINLLNMYGVIIDEFSDKASVKYISTFTPAIQQIFVNAEINPAALIGNAAITDYSYNKQQEITEFQLKGDKKYVDSLEEIDHNLKITAFKQENADIDTLPLVQNIDFTLDLPASDEHYIYVNTNLFSSMRVNPFMEVDRHTTIDLRYCRSNKIYGLYKIPAGYTAEVLPKTIKIIMPDNSVVFNRVVAQEDGEIKINCSLTFKKTLYNISEYPELYNFFKKMFEMLNEQIVLKKS